MNNKPIGVFDSGVGGLSSLKVLKQLLPDEQLIFFGDTGRMPYGDKSKEELKKIAQSDVDFLLSKDVKAILIACGTVSSTCLRQLRKDNALPIYGVIDAPVQKAAQMTETKKVGIIATRATVASGAFQRRLKRLDPEIRVKAVSCRKLAPMVEAGHYRKDDPLVCQTLESYLKRFNDIDTLILGCTHYALLREAIDEHFDHRVKLVDAASEGAISLADYLKENNMLAEENKGEDLFYCSGDSDFFARKLRMFIGREAEVIKNVI